MSDRLIIDGVEHRFIRRWRNEYALGYAEPDEVCYNVLQRRLRGIFRFSGGWMDVEEERVPSFAWLQQATLGFTEWESDLEKKARRLAEKTRT